MIRFSAFHPTVSALYFLSVLLILMFSSHPFLLLIALFSGLLFFLQTQPRLPSWKEVAFYLFLFLLIALSNPLFSHNGKTPLFFLNGNPVTLESVLYGVNLAVMLLAVLFWFQCFNRIITEDKLLYLFGKFSPRLALMLSSALRFLPLLKTQTEKIRQTQQAMGLFTSESWSDQLRGGARVYSSLITWALENAIDTGASMKARGYGLPGRTHYSLFRFCRADALLLVFILLMDAITLSALATSQLSFAFYPALSTPAWNLPSCAGLAAFAILCFFPFILEGKERLQWNYLRSKI